jgi:hypothetical protein
VVIVPSVVISLPTNFDEAIEPASMALVTLLAPMVVAIPVDVTSPVRLPVKVAAAPEVSPVTFPMRFAVTVPAEKFPEGSLLTRALTVFRPVAALARFAPEATLAAARPPTVATVEATEPLPLVVTSPVSPVI